MTITQTIDPISPVPDIADPATFETRANTLLTQKLPTLATQLNALIVQFNALAGDVQANADTWVGAIGAANHWYPRASASDPTQRPDGTAVQEGDIYFNSTLAVFKTRFLGVWQVVNVNAAALAASSGASLLGYSQGATGGAVRTVQDRLRDLAVHVRDFGAIGDGTVHQLSSVYATLGDAQVKYPFATSLSQTLDYCALQAALNTGLNVDLGSLDLLIDTQLNVTKKGQRIFGRGMAAGGVSGDSITRIRATADIEYFRVSSQFVLFENALFDTPTVAHTQPHIRFVNGSDGGTVLRCRVNGAGSDGGAGPGITFDDGAGGVGTAVVGLVMDTYVVHASVIVRIPDVKVRGGYVWALSKQYGIAVFNGVSNFTADTVDIVPPLSTTAGKKAGVYVSGAAVNAMLVDCYLDGNPSLSTGKAVLFENGCLAPSVIGGKANLCDDDVITFDSVIAPVVDGVTFYNNNQQGTGASDIVFTNTFAQLMEKPRVVGTSHIQSAAGVGTRGAAVKVAAGCARRGIEISASIHQPGTGGGYIDTEILLEDGAFLSDNEGSLRGSRGTRTQYKGSANAAYVLGDTFKTISWPATMAYAPRIDQLRVTVSNASGAGATPVRVQTATTGNVGIGFVSGGAPTAGTLYVAAEL